jgi:hypothetical protein
MAEQVNTPITPKPTTPKKKVGRPLFDGKDEAEVVRKLEEAFALGCSDLEACLYADIGKTAFYKYQDSHPEFAERKEVLKERPILQARNAIIESIRRGDGNLALKYLERKRKSEFALRTEVTGKDGEKLMPMPILGGATQEKSDA